MPRPVNILMIGHGMMGTWHSEALRDRTDCILHTLVGKTHDAAANFAERFAYRKVTTDLHSALADPAIDAVIIASPSEHHATMALAAITAGKPALVEIPLAMTLAACEHLVEAADAAGVMMAVCHPMRFRICRAPLLVRVRERSERIVQVQGRFCIHRLVNIGATGIRRDWTDNILWHHMTHLVDCGLFLAGGGNPESVRLRRVEGFMPDSHPVTGIPMDIGLMIETEDGATIIATGSYLARERLYEVMTITDRDSYRVDEIGGTMTSAAGIETIESEQQNAWRVARDFVIALQDGRSPLVTARSVLPAMRVLEQVQRQWDDRFGERDLPGRPLDQFATETKT